MDNFSRSRGDLAQCQSQVEEGSPSLPVPSPGSPRRLAPLQPCILQPLLAWTVLPLCSLCPRIVLVPSFPPISRTTLANMRFSVFVLLAWLAAGVAARGRRVGYEKIMMFYAWRIDQLLPIEDRVIGVKCAIPPPNGNGGDGPCGDPPVTNLPTPKYVHCTYNDMVFDPAARRRVAVRRPCVYLRHFMSHVDDPRNWANANFHGGANRDATDFDIQETVRILNERGADQNRVHPWRYFKDSVSPEILARDGGRRSYNGQLDSVFNHIAHVKRTISQADFDANSNLFDKMEVSRALLIRARQADADYHLMNEFRRRVPTVDIKSFPLGYRDGNGAQQREATLFLREETMAGAKMSERWDMWDVETAFEANDPRRAEHRIVMESIREGGLRVNRVCR